MTSSHLKAWHTLTSAEQDALMTISARLGLGLTALSPEAAEARGLNFQDAFVTGQLFHQGTLYFDPARATVDDLTHDLGHALGLSPAQRAAFRHPEGDIDTSEDVAMLGQWAIARAALPDYDLAASLEDFGYHFGYVDHGFEGLDGSAWARNLANGHVLRSELALYCHLQDQGLVQAPPRLRPAPRKASWETGPDWLPAWAEAAYAPAIAAVVAPPAVAPLPPAVRARRRRVP